MFSSYHQPVLDRLKSVLLLLMWAIVLAGCGRSTLRHDEFPASRAVEGVGRGFFEHRVEAFVVPPARWKLDPPKISARHTHLAWISPSGDTAYGVIYARIPGYVPVALMPQRMLHAETLERVIAAMRDDQGEATLLRQRWDGRARRMHFKAEGGLYRIDSVLSVRGHSAWVLYVGRLREHEPNEPEIVLARRARESTRVGLEAREVAAGGK